MKSSTIVYLFILITQICERGKDVLSCGQLRTTLIPLLTNTHTTHHWPWHVAIYHQDSKSNLIYKCGGTLISSNSILTAAHCVMVDVEDVTISLGRLLLNVSESSTHFVKVIILISVPPLNTLLLKSSNIQRR